MLSSSAVARNDLPSRMHRAIPSHISADFLVYDSGVPVKSLKVQPHALQK